MPHSKVTTPEQVNHLGDLSESSPVKDGQRPIAGHDRDELAKYIIPNVTENIDVKEMWKLLDPSEERKEVFDKFSKGCLKRNTEKYVDYFNRLSRLLYDNKYKGKGKGFIRFIECPSREFRHPTGTLCRADLVAVKDTKPMKLIEEIRSTGGKQYVKSDEAERSKLLDKLSWSQLEAVGEIQSEGRSQTESEHQSASYTAYLLQARPDLVSVVGIFVNPQEFRPCISNACGVAYMRSIRWTSTSAPPILCAWIARIYEPILDPSIKRINASKGGVGFNITHGDKSTDLYEITWVGTAFGRRTTVFETPSRDNLVIKYQYIELGRRFSEENILKIIHGQTVFPGVVRIMSQPDESLKEYKIEAQMERGGAKGKGLEERKRTRLEMRDKAVPLMDAETPYAFLVALYDLLEVTRFLYRKRGVLHRDISDSNVRIRSQLEDYKEAEEIADFKDMHFATFLLRRQNHPSKIFKIETERGSKTTYFRALPYSWHVQFVLARSKEVQPDSRGKNKDAPKTTHWSNLTGGSGTDDPRTFFLGPFPSNVCHEAYQPLEGLLEKMAEQLKGHPELTKERDKEEYLHEAFQRIIFEFISSQYQEPFMPAPYDLRKRKYDHLSGDKLSENQSTNKKKLAKKEVSSEK
ncbi:hypothetical protein CPB86DRAFT_830672 [Serendipita vermifera]|nr:hypothetical protein CPB86DRAFT_830672 [Serendipita vermifera]